jgi:uncharacterized protein
MRRSHEDNATEEFMKAVLALVVIYVAIFLIAIQGASQSSVQASPQTAGAVQEQTTPASVDPGKQANIRSLMELMGVRDLVQDATSKGTQQFRENLVASVPNNDRGQEFVNAFIQNYQKRLSPDDLTNQLVTIYDKHFTDEDIKSLLQFYGSPVGQKYAAEMPKITAEVQAANRAVGMRVGKEVLQDLRRQYPGIGAQARLNRPQAQQPERARQQHAVQTDIQASSSQP